ncbi:MAG TPA: acyltransferase [Thermodesulfobacteriota bacterium]|nr:acyltransferase [Thermodesulfobacteriota bacterium]
MPLDSNIDHVDIVKGLGVIGLITAHSLSLSYIYEVGFYREPNVEWTFFPYMIAAARQLVDFVPRLFLLVSGYIISLRYPTSISNVQAFYKRRLLRIYPPLLVWIPVYYLMEGKFTLTKLIADIVFIRGSIHLWFVWAILIDYLLFPGMLSLENRFLRIGPSSVNHRRYVAILLILLIISSFCNNLLPVSVTSSQFITYTLNHRILILPDSILFFAIGIYMARIGGTDMSVFLCPSRYRILILVLATCTAGIVSFFHQSFDSSLLQRTIRTMLYLTCVFSALSIVPVICSVIMNAGKGIARVMGQLGKSSYGIFLGHMAVLKASQAVLHSIFNSSPATDIIPLFLIAMTVCCLPVLIKKNSISTLLGYY